MKFWEIGIWKNEKQKHSFRIVGDVFFWFFDVLVVIVVMIESTDIEKET